ncbi:hypothetical protein HW532_20825 [Kaustia mangrovi]|uniref:Uncharacterized protein n=1 Tax=Kaustia mangrovi TaxID=2593653 RepID=A0A7S8HDW8_9HYPH|nr:hypothetical protein [Kaustia mangrovi]QPC44924.1 hypothetical protein HW532_20825 [Kaustia mangrovi]
MSDNTKDAAKAANEASDAAFASDVARILKSVSKNPAEVEFPRDPWGMTTELRRAGLRAAASVRGNEEKQRLYLATLQVLAAHVKARLKDDQAAFKARLERQAALARNERVYGRYNAAPAPAPAKEEAVPAKGTEKGSE